MKHLAASLVPPVEQFVDQFRQRYQIARVGLHHARLHIHQRQRFILCRNNALVLSEILIKDVASNGKEPCLYACLSTEGMKAGERPGRMSRQIVPPPRRANSHPSGWLCIERHPVCMLYKCFQNPSGVLPPFFPSAYECFSAGICYRMIRW